MNEHLISEKGFTVKRFTVKHGQVRLLFALDIGEQVNLLRCQELSGNSAVGSAIISGQRAPKDLSYEALQFKFDAGLGPFELQSYRFAADVDAELFDFGGLVLSLHADLVEVEDRQLVELSELIYQSEELVQFVRQMAHTFLNRFRLAVQSPLVAEQIEDYVVWEFYELGDETSWIQFVSDHIALLAQIITAENSTQLSDEQIAETFRLQNAYSKLDRCVLGWDGALALGPVDFGLRAVLRVLNSQLQQLRFLDRKLESSIDEAHSLVERKLPFLQTLRQVRGLKQDGAFFFEAVNNPVKLVSDHYLAQVYRQGVERFHLNAWQETVRSKLEFIEESYDTLVDRTRHLLAVTLELTVIVLILVEVLVALRSG